MSLSGLKPMLCRIELMMPRFSSSDIVAYVRRRKFIHIGRRIKTNSVLYFEKSLLARKYAAG